jgi:hypothetical protein
MAYIILKVICKWKNKTDLSICTLFKQLSEIYLDIMRVKYVNKCELLKNTIRFGSSLVPSQDLLDSAFGFCPLTSAWLLGGCGSRHSHAGFQSSLLRSRGNHICLENCRRNACSVLCVGVGTRLANRYVVMGDFTVGTMFTQPLASNGRLRRLRSSGFVGRNVDNLSCMNYVSYLTNHQAPQLTDVTTD